MASAAYIEAFINQLGHVHGIRGVTPFGKGRWVLTSNAGLTYGVDYDTAENVVVVWRYSGLTPRVDQQATAYQTLLEMNSRSRQYGGVRASLSAEGEIVLCVMLPSRQCDNASFHAMCRSTEVFLERFWEAVN